MKLIPVILSGGAGTRLWPVSREQHPKPFIRLADGQSLLQKSFLRAKSLPDVQRQNIVRSPAPGLYEIHQAHAFGYVTADGRYLVSGDLIDMQSGARLTDQRRNQERQGRSAQLRQDDPTLSEKLSFAQTLVGQTIVTDDNLAYTTETDLIDQEAANREKLDEEWRQRLSRRQP